MKERRRSARFQVRQSALLNILHREFSEVHGITDNVSEFGALIIADSTMPVGASVDVTLTLHGENLPTVQLVTLGKVVRMELPSEPGGVRIAIDCGRGFQQRRKQGLRVEVGINRRMSHDVAC